MTLEQALETKISKFWEDTATLYDRIKAEEWVMTEHRCPACHRALTDKEEVYFVDNYGFCVMCDTEKADNDRRLYEEINKESEYDKFMRYI